MIILADLNKHNFPTTPEIDENLNDLCGRLNVFLEKYSLPVGVNSGLRNAELQAQVNPKAPNSNHLVGRAADIHDEGNNLMNFVLENMELAKGLDLFFEHFNFTPTWVHIQIVSPRSGHRIFIPNPGPPLCTRWNGVYDTVYDLTLMEIHERLAQ